MLKSNSVISCQSEKPKLTLTELIGNNENGSLEALKRLESVYLFLAGPNGADKQLPSVAQQCLMDTVSSTKGNIENINHVITQIEHAIGFSN